MKRQRRRLKVAMAVVNDLASDQRVNRIATTLVEAGYEVTVWGRKSRDSPKLQPRPYRTRRFACFFSKGKAFYAEFMIRMFWAMLRERADVVVANDLDTLAPCFWAAKITRAKLVYDTHEYFTQTPELVRRPLEQRLWTLWERWYFPKLKNVMTVNERIAEAYRKLYDKNVTAVRNVPHRIPPETLPRCREPIVLYQGAINEGRGVEKMVDCAPFIEGELWIIGTGDVFGCVKRRVEALPPAVRARVRLFGRLPMERLAPLTRQAQIGLSIEEDRGLNYRYATPNKLFDYLQSGVPVVVSPLPEMAKVVLRYGAGVVMNDHSGEALTAAIYFLRNAVYEQARVGAQKAARELCWEQESRVLLDFYRHLR
ncbi:MAG: glycosyltransferase [Bacteroidia bacterium]|nr:glycosyltransferase [Bacteroidia bacterium]MDW8334009.1 glycosyltransferase [Bacteroidia bacterium]